MAKVTVDTRRRGVVAGKRVSYRNVEREQGFVGGECVGEGV